MRDGTGMRADLEDVQRRAVAEYEAALRKMTPEALRHDLKCNIGEEDKARIRAELKRRGLSLESGPPTEERLRLLERRVAELEDEVRRGRQSLL
jgi:hypothetical protein